MRTWVYQTLANDVPLGDLLDDRIYQASRSTKVPKDKMYAYYRMGVASSRLHSIETPVLVTPFQVFVQDVPGDYLQIDSAMARLRGLFSMHPPAYPDARFISSTWLEVSADLPEDPLTGTISKFIRCQVVHKP